MNKKMPVKKSLKTKRISEYDIIPLKQTYETTKIFHNCFKGVFDEKKIKIFF